MHTFIYEYMMDLVAPLVAPALSQKPAVVTYFVARGAPRPCYIPEGFDSLPYRVPLKGSTWGPLKGSIGFRDLRTHISRLLGPKENSDN